MLPRHGLTRDATKRLCVIEHDLQQSPSPLSVNHEHGMPGRSALHVDLLQPGDGMSHVWPTLEPGAKVVLQDSHSIAFGPIRSLGRQQSHINEALPVPISYQEGLLVTQTSRPLRVPMSSAGSWRGTPLWCHRKPNRLCFLLHQPFPRRTGLSCKWHSKTALHCR